LTSPFEKKRKKLGNTLKNDYTWKSELNELNGMTSPEYQNPAWGKWIRMCGVQKKIGLAMQITLDELKCFVQEKISGVEKRFK
jgi:hypothetical protein